MDLSVTFRQAKQNANAAFLVARRGDQSTKKREQALQNLENAYFKYKEIISNLDVGRKFYNDLAKITNRFRDDCRGFNTEGGGAVERDRSVCAVTALILIFSYGFLQGRNTGTMILYDRKNWRFTRQQ